MESKFFPKLIFGLIMAALVVLAGFLIFGKKPAGNSPKATLQDKPKFLEQGVEGAQKSSGIIRAVYEKDGKKFIDVDAVEMNPAWDPNKAGDVPYKNFDTEIKTLELSPDAQFVLVNPEKKTIDFSAFQKFFDGSVVTPIMFNPWDIYVLNGKVVEVAEHFIP